MIFDKQRRTMATAVLAALTFFAAPASAEITTGSAAITDSTTAARQEAIKDALRELVLRKVSVFVSSKTEVSLGELVADEVTTKADGYVQINKIVKEWQAEGFYFVELDADASEQKISTAVQDLKSRLQTMSDQETSRSGIALAVVERDAGGNYRFAAADIMPYMEDKLNAAGFAAAPNEQVTNYLVAHAADPNSGLEARRLARENREMENALLRGVLAVEDVHRRKDGLYVATVKASFELIGLDSNRVDAFSRYFSATGGSAFDAERKAKDEATRTAVEALGQQALETVQSEMRGGARHIKITVDFNGLTNLPEQQAAIKKALTAAKCKILRSTMAGGNTFRLFVVTDAYGTIGDLQDAIQKQLPGAAVMGGDANSLGSTKLTFSL